MNDLPDPNIFTPPPAEAPVKQFDVATALREAGQPISIGTNLDTIFADLTEAVTVPTRFAEAIPDTIALERRVYPPGKPRYENIRARLFNLNL